jgi:hypothetical protein
MQNSHLDDSRTAGSESTEPGWFDKSENVSKLIGLLVMVCIGLVLADLVYTNDHHYFKLESIIGFQAWLGFIAFVVIVFMGRMLRPIVRRPEDYYD